MSLHTARRSPVLQRADPVVWHCKFQRGWRHPRGLCPATSNHSEGQNVRRETVARPGQHRAASDTGTGQKVCPAPNVLTFYRHPGASARHEPVQSCFHSLWCVLIARPLTRVALSAMWSARGRSAGVRTLTVCCAQVPRSHCRTWAWEQRTRPRKSGTSSQEGMKGAPLLLHALLSIVPH